jgi:hypothetical protein
VSLVQKHAQRAYELLLDRKRWTTGVLARDKDGDMVSVRNTDAVCWCAEGAITRVTKGTFDAPEKDGDRRFRELALQLGEQLRVRGFGAAVFAVNDGPNGHAHILEALDAIAEGA